MLFTRASASHFLTWLKLPAGSRLPRNPLPLGSNPPILPKRSRLFTVAILVATAVVLFLPQSRVAVSTVRATLQGLELWNWNSDQHTLEKLAARAEKEKDARTLAFAALTMSESDLSMRLADKAVSLDPSLTWIYASHFYRMNSVPLPAEWLARLHASDPDNGFIDLTAADAIAQPHFWAMAAHRTPAPGEFESVIANDPQWVAQMETAFRAPHYDNYLHKHWELICYGWNRDPAISPAIIGYGLWSRRFPNLQNVQIFAKIQIHRAQQALISGHPDQAARILQEVDGFASRMSEQGEASFERMAALDLSRQATEEFRNLYLATGRAREASEASARLQEIENRHRSLISLPYLVETDTLRREATIFQTSAILLFACGVIMALSVLLLEIRPRPSRPRRAAWQRILCRTADYTPATLLILSFAFFVSFLPIARLFAQYRSASASIETFREIRGTLWGVMDVPLSVQEVLNPPFFWWFVTIALVILAALLLYRIFSRSKPTPQAAR